MNTETRILGEFEKELCQNITRKVIRYLQSMKDTMSALANEIDKLKGQLSSFSDKSGKVVQVVQETQKALKGDEPHPKQGYVKPEDVAVEKMFYFGRK